MKYFKVNQDVYHASYGEGIVVSDNYNKDYPILVQFQEGRNYFMEDGRQYEDDVIVLSQTPIIKIMNKPLEEYVPFTFEDDLLGMKVVSKDKSCKAVIVWQDRYRIIIGQYLKTYEDLLRDYTFIDGSRCGKI